MASKTCLMCPATFPAPVGAKERRFCSTGCRKAFHEGCRHLGERLFRDGAVTIEQIKGEAKQ